MKNLVVFASGNGSNAVRLIEYFEHHSDIRVKAIFCNRPDAPVILRARRNMVPCLVFNQKTLGDETILELLDAFQADYIILAGFLLKVPEHVLKRYPDRVLNIHPALLPKHGGKGMYGQHVHASVLKEGEKESGISIHVVNGEYDEGQILFQAKCAVAPEDTLESLTKKIQQLEHQHFPEVVERYITTHG
jgi:phosphoribosylglycinamide formyltransferase-1